jgi:phage replication O-like protein O
MIENAKKTGFTKIDNYILENLAKAKLSGTQFSLILIICRYTNGFQRDEHELALSFLAKATGYSQRNIQRALKSMALRKIIFQKSKDCSTRKISINNDVHEWLNMDCKTELFMNKTDNGENDISHKSRNKCGETDKDTYGDIAKKERNKEKHIENIDNSLKNIWKLLPTQLSLEKIDAEQKAKLFDEVGYDKLEAAVQKYSETIATWDRKFIMHGETFFTGRYKEFLPTDEDKKPIKIIYIERDSNVDVAKSDLNLKNNNEEEVSS